MADLTAYWPARLSGHPELRLRLLAAYREPQRRYHDLRHLTEVLVNVEQILTAGTDRVDRDAVLLAAWFHDAVYERDGEDEEHSAALAARELAAAGMPSTLVHEVRRLVRLTATHRPAGEDANGAVLCDADLAVLAADGRRYREYVAGVRAEFAHVEDEQFRAGRAAVLRDLLAMPVLFQTSFAHERWERRARANLSAELAVLTGHQ